MGTKHSPVIAIGRVIPLCGCGAVDSGVTFLPESLRQPAPKVAEIEQPPDVHLIVQATSVYHFLFQRNMADRQHASKHRLEV
jgi:hypothetical protein